MAVPTDRMSSETFAVEAITATVLVCPNSQWMRIPYPFTYPRVRIVATDVVHSVVGGYNETDLGVMITLTRPHGYARDQSIFVQLTASPETAAPSSTNTAGSGVSHWQALPGRPTTAPSGATTATLPPQYDASHPAVGGALNRHRSLTAAGFAAHRVAPDPSTVPQQQQPYEATPSLHRAPSHRHLTMPSIRQQHGGHHPVGTHGGGGVYVPSPVIFPTYIPPPPTTMPANAAPLLTLAPFTNTTNDEAINPFTLAIDERRQTFEAEFAEQEALHRSRLDNMRWTALCALLALVATIVALVAIPMNIDKPALRNGLCGGFASLFAIPLVASCCFHPKRMLARLTLLMVCFAIVYGVSSRFALIYMDDADGLALEEQKLSAAQQAVSNLTACPFTVSSSTAGSRLEPVGSFEPSTSGATLTLASSSIGASLNVNDVFRTSTAAGSWRVLTSDSNLTKPRAVNGYCLGLLGYTPASTTTASVAASCSSASSSIYALVFACPVNGATDHCSQVSTPASCGFASNGAPSLVVVTSTSSVSQVAQDAVVAFGLTATGAKVAVVSQSAADASWSGIVAAIAHKQAAQQQAVLVIAPALSVDAVILLFALAMAWLRPSATVS